MAKKPQQLDETMAVRIRAASLTRFKKKSLKSAGKPYHLLIREIVDAFNDGRLHITPTPEQQNAMGELYVTGK